MTAKPDGYTLATAVSTIVLVPQMQKVAFDPFKDFTYIQQFAAFPVGVTVKTDSPFKSWADVIAHAKANLALSPMVRRARAPTCISVWSACSATPESN
jgi:tripartite-type tricarboxylate transporter receptor subunit TctC